MVLAPMQPGRNRVTETPRSLPLLSVEASGRVARPLRAWDQANRLRLANLLLEVLEQWQASYGLPQTGSPEGGPNPVRCWEVPSRAKLNPNLSAWQILPSLEGSAEIWWTLHPSLGTDDTAHPSAGWHGAMEPRKALLEALFAAGENQGGNLESLRLADEVAQAAWMDWCQSLTAVFTGISGNAPRNDREADPQRKPSAPPASILQPWSGSLLLTFPWCGQTMEVLVGFHAISTAIGNDGAFKKRSLRKDSGQPQLPLVPVLQAVSELRLTLCVELFPFEIDLGSLTSLRPGDVLRTSHSLEAPAILTNPLKSGQLEADILCGGFLGKRNARRAVELTAKSSLSIPSGF